MTEREMLEAESKWCENCCNFDRERSDPGGVAPCKVNGALVYAECYEEECRFRNVPAENVVAVGRCRDCNWYSYTKGECTLKKWCVRETDYCTDFMEK